jgi:hypothetical protein
MNVVLIANLNNLSEQVTKKFNLQGLRCEGGGGERERGREGEREREKSSEREREREIE